MKRFIATLFMIFVFAFTLASCENEGSKKYRVTFDGQNGDIEVIKVEEGLTVEKPADPNKSGFVFEGWFLDLAGEKPYNFNNPVTKDLTLYAKWSDETITFIVSFETDGGTAIEDQEVRGGAKVAKPADPEKSGFIFKGWFLNLTDENPYDFDKRVTTDLILYAKWFDESTKYTVSFETNGGTLVESQEVVYGTSVDEPAAPTKELAIFDKWYKDEELTEEFDFSASIESATTIYAGYKTVYVLGTSLNNGYATYLRNIKEQVNKLIEFKVRTNPYTVGTMNAWNALPQLELATYDEVSEDFEDCELAWKFSLELLVDGNPVDTLEYVDSFDEVNGLIDFSDAAAGLVFTVKLIPAGLTPRQLTEVEKYTSQYMVEVVDGYNVYSALELAYLENRRSEQVDYCGSIVVQNKVMWDAFKEEKGLALNFNPSTIIIHNDLVITADDLPSGFFYDDTTLSKTDSDYERTYGSLLDFTELYYRNVAEGEEVKVLGNYFNLDASQIREIQREDNEIKPVGTALSHSSLIRFQEKGKVLFANLSVNGNAPRIENSVKAGGIILLKYTGPEVHIDNVLSYDFFISFMPNWSFTPTTIENVKVVNSYNCFIYNWGSEDVTVRNSEFSSSGGPVIIQDCVAYGEPNQGTGKTVFENCVFDSYVTGQETWFVGFNATALVGQVKALDLVLNAYGKSFLKTNKDNVTYFNLITVNKGGSDAAITTTVIEGSTKIDDSAYFDFGATDPYLSAMCQTAYQYGAPMFQGSNSTPGTGYGLFNGQYLVDVAGNPIVDPTNPLFTSKYIAIYYNGMCMILELFDLGETYNG